MRLIDDGSFQQVPQVDDSILANLRQKFGLNTEQKDKLDAVSEKATEEERVDAKEEVSQPEQRTKKMMDAPTQQHPPPTLIASKVPGVMAISRKGLHLRSNNKILRSLPNA